MENRKRKLGDWPRSSTFLLSIIFHYKWSSRNRIRENKKKKLLSKKYFIFLNDFLAWKSLSRAQNDEWKMTPPKFIIKKFPKISENKKESLKASMGVGGGNLLIQAYGIQFLHSKNLYDNGPWLSKFGGNIIPKKYSVPRWTFSHVWG